MGAFEPVSTLVRKMELPTVVAEEPFLAERAQRIAERFKLPYASDHDGQTRFLLVLTRRRLEIRDKRGAIGKGFAIDFAIDNPRVLGLRGGRSREPLRRAVGVKTGTNASVLDATAGLGRDSLVLAALGYHVTMCERSPAIAALLQDGLYRAQRNSGFVEHIGNRLRLQAGDAMHVLSNLPARLRPQVIYIDPMYPIRARSAFVKKEMQFLRALVGQDEDGPALLAVALESAARRVVVKRRKGDPDLSSGSPSHRIVSGQVRFDVYLRKPPRNA